MNANHASGTRGETITLIAGGMAMDQTSAGPPYNIPASRVEQVGSSYILFIDQRTCNRDQCVAIVCYALGSNHHSQKIGKWVISPQHKQQ